MARWFDASHADFDARFAAFLAEPRGQVRDVRTDVAAIISDVRTRGFAGLAAHTQRLDGITITEETVRISAEQMAEAAARIDPDDRAALSFAAARIRAYHARQIPVDHMFTDEAGVTMGWRWTALDAAGLYAPGGRASYPSSVLMNAIPARVAGVKRLALVTPTPQGRLNPLVLAAAQEAGVDEVFTIGGAQAVAALAYGAGPIAPVDTIVGPGNAWVTEAKRQVFGDVGIDTIAGPSEVLVVADAGNNAAHTAADVLAQAEHDPAAQSILLTDDRAFGEAVEAAVAATLPDLATREVAAASWQAHGAIVVLGSLDQAADIINQIAPEHLMLAVADPAAITAQVRHAGAIFEGRETTEALGDYVTGPNHVLPTSRAARFASGLSVLDFMKRTTVQRAGAAGLALLGPHAARLARAEGLPAHALSVEARLADERE